MTDDKLKEACKLADLRVEEWSEFSRTLDYNDDPVEYQVWGVNLDGWFIFPHNIALKPVIAERLMEVVRKRDKTLQAYRAHMVLKHGSFALVEDAEKRIEVAMYVLKEGA